MAKKNKDNEELQEPLEAKKSSGGMKLPMMIGIIVGILALNAVIIFLLFNFLITPTLNTNSDPQAKTEQSKDGTEKKKKKASEEDEYLQGDENLIFLESGRITTNPKDSDRFVVINLGLEFRPKEKEKNTFEPKMLAKIKGIVNNTFAAMTIEEIHSKRDSLDVIFHKNLMSVFKKDDKYLHEVILQEFMISN